MGATYAVQRGTGAGPTWATVSNVRFRADDANTSDLTNPCIIDTVLRHSFWANVCIVPSGTFTQVSNIRHYSDGAIGWTFGTNGGLFRGNRDSGDKGVPDGSYQQATGTAGTDGDPIETTHTYYSGQTTKTTNIQSDTTGSPALIDSSLITVASTRSKHIVMQVRVDTDGTSGVQATETLTWRVDEI